MPVKVLLMQPLAWIFHSKDNKDTCINTRLVNDIQEPIYFALDPEAVQLRPLPTTPMLLPSSGHNYFFNCLS